MVLQFHGCGGVRPLQQLYAQTALDAGAAVVIVDSFAPRGITRLTGSALVCTGMMLRGAERAIDLFALYDWARSQPWVEETRIAAAGWSHGSWTIMDGLALGERARRSRLADLPPEPLEGLAGAILIYPYSAFPSLTSARGWGGYRPKVFALTCGKDQVVGVRYPARAIGRLERDGLSVEQLFLPDATHAFDDDNASDPRAVFRPDLLDKARAWYGAALRTTFA